MVLMLCYPAVSYTIGLMQSGSFNNDLVVVWACFLLGCSDGIATCSVDGNDNQARIMLNQATQVLYVLILLFSYMGTLHRQLKILLLCRYVRRRSWHSHHVMEVLLWLLCRATLTTRYWSNSVGQYSILHACLENERSWLLQMPLHHWVNGRLMEARTVTRRSLPTAVKEAIHQFIVRSNLNMRTGMHGDYTLQINNLSSDFQWSTSRYRYGYMGNLLIWHIATVICSAGAGRKVPRGYEVATILSNYCAYLIFQAPELLTDAIYDQRLLMQSLHRRIQRHLRLNRCRSERDMVDMLLALEPSEVNIREEAILADGIKLARLILARMNDDMELQWKVLADMWVELLVTVTPSDNASAHVKKLATGGELITHLWAMLTHGGVIERPFPRGPERQYL